MVANKFFIGIRGDQIVFMRPVPIELSKSDALNLAAHLVAMAADSYDLDFKPLYDEVCSS